MPSQKSKDLIANVNAYIGQLEAQISFYEQERDNIHFNEKRLSDELFRILFKDLPTPFITGIRENFTNRLTAVAYIRKNSKNTFLCTLYGAVAFVKFLENEGFNE